jgi:hypothetical protein
VFAVGAQNQVFWKMWNGSTWLPSAAAWEGL